jgi:hypothetical protein
VILFRPFPEKTLDQIDTDDLQRLIAAQVEESLFLEYKSDMSSRGVSRTVAAFANTEGGTLILGMRTEGRRPVELLGLEAQGDLGESLDQMVRSSIAPRPDVRFWQVDDPATGKSCLVVEVPPGAARPYLLTRTGQIMRRTPTASEPADRDYVDQLFREGRAGLAWATSTADERLKDTGTRSAFLWTVPCVEGGLSFGTRLFTQASLDRLTAIAEGFPEVSTEASGGGFGVIRVPPKKSSQVTDTGLRVLMTDDFNERRTFSLRVQTTGEIETVWSDERGSSLSINPLVEVALPMHKRIYHETFWYHGQVAVAIRNKWSVPLSGDGERVEFVAFRNPAPILADDLDAGDLADSLKRQAARAHGRWEPEP